MLRVEANSPFRMRGDLQEMSYHCAIRSRCPWWEERKPCQEREGRGKGYSQCLQILVFIYCCKAGGFQDQPTCCPVLVSARQCFCTTCKPRSVLGTS